MRSILSLLALGLATVAAAAEPTYTKDVAPILFGQCVACHRDGEIGPFPLLTYADAKKRARLIASVTADRTMPPWKPDPGHGEFRDERRLTDAQIRTLQDWLAAGTPEGDAKDLPKKPTFKAGWKLGKPDVVLKMAKPFAVPAEGRDVYHQFVFPLDLKEDKYLIGVECRPGNPKVAHHAVGILDTSGTARKLDAKHDGPGYPGIGPGFLPAGFTPGYVPGQTPRFLNDGCAITLKKGTDFVLQMHYHPSGKDETDQTEIGLYFTKTPPTKHMAMIMMASEQIDIPAGEAQYRARDEFVLPVDLKIESMWAHMHCIGKTVTVRAELPGKKQKKLLRISDWDFNWQDTYHYKEPLTLPKGTKVTAEFTWDNTKDNPRNPFSPPKRIRLGEGSTDEMSGLILGGIANDGSDVFSHWGAVIGHYAEVKIKGLPYQR